jgi:multidrug efflux pump subunit AcrA (membrane-fusion protein)
MKNKTMNRKTWLIGVAVVATAVVAWAADDKAPSSAANGASAPKAALTVTAATPQTGRWPITVSANGNIMAWQEAVISAETQGLRLTDVRVQVGDRVKRGQVLALLSADTLSADAAAMRASLVEAEANQAEAAANAERARQLQASGAISAQQIQQYVTAEATAKARAASMKAQLNAAQVRLAQTRITAPDDGVISARMATIGVVAQPGQELFKLIRKERLEWRADGRCSHAQRHRLCRSGGVCRRELDRQGRHVRARRLCDRRARGGDAAAKRGRAARRFQLGLSDRARQQGAAAQGERRRARRRARRDHRRLVERRARRCARRGLPRRWRRGPHRRQVRTAHT